jgi:pilus assembly protein Flp/PilA
MARDLKDGSKALQVTPQSGRLAAPGCSPFHQLEFIMKTLISAVRSFVADEDGVTALEYGMLAALIAAVIVGSVTTIGTKLGAMFDTIKNAI